MRHSGSLASLFGEGSKPSRLIVEKQTSKKCSRIRDTAMAAKQNNAFDVTCPDCGAVLKIDPQTRAIVSHTPAPRKRTFEDFETAARAMREQDERKESIFRQSVEAEKNKQELFDKKFEEAVRKAKETPSEGKPLREFDLD
jgi:hypothetical protein